MRFIILVIFLLLSTCDSQNLESLSFKGTIGSKIGVTGDLKVSGNTITGQYHYNSIKLPVQIKGTVQNNSIAFDGTDPDGVWIDHFEGLIMKDNSLVGRWQSADGERSMPFDFKTTSLVYSSNTAESNQYLLMSGVGLLIVLFIVLASKPRKKKVLSSPKAETRKANSVKPTSPNIIRDLSPEPLKSFEQMSTKEKGHAFEEYIISILPLQYYDLHRWRSDKITRKGRSPSDSKQPDLELIKKNSASTKGKFAVECKWRNSISKRFVDLDCERKFNNYVSFAREEAVPTFIALGVSGKPKEPEHIYIIPLDKVEKSPFKGSNQYGVYYQDLSQYEKKNGHKNLFYNESDLTLQ